MRKTFEESVGSARRLAAAGRHEEALAATDSLIAAHADQSIAHGVRGDVLAAMGRAVDAEAAYRRALALDRHSASALFGLAELLIASGRNDEALDTIEGARRLHPRDPRGPRLLGRMHLERGLAQQACAWFEAALELEPRDVDTMANLGLSRQTSGDLAGARSCYLDVLGVEAGHPGALRGLARLAEVAGRPEDALGLIEPVVRAGAADAGLCAVYGRLLGQAGRLDDALATVQERLGAAIADADADRMVLQFELGSLLDRAARYDEAMPVILEANRLKAADFDPDNYRRLVSRLIAAFPADRLAAGPRSRLRDERPVLIVGMPRSGSSLVEQILASHPQVHGAGELTELGLLALSTAGDGLEYPESALAQDQKVLEALSRVYLQRLDQLAPGARRVTDKMWQNFEFLGLAELILPGARVIHCVRDAQDTGLSCFFQHFFGHGVAFSYDLAHIGAYYRQYRRTMDHWRRVLSLPMHTVRYEDLVAAPEAATRTLLRFLDLPWDDACLRFFETTRPVRTASYAQVRQPIYRGSVGRHRHYARWLAPLVQALGDACQPATAPVSDDSG